MQFPDEHVAQVSHTLTRARNFKQPYLCRGLVQPSLSSKCLTGTCPVAQAATRYDRNLIEFNLFSQAVSMGFEVDSVKEALRYCQGDVSKAINMLASNGGKLPPISHSRKGKRKIIIV